MMVLYYAYSPRVDWQYSPAGIKENECVVKNAFLIILLQ